MIIKDSTIFDWLEANVKKYPELTGEFSRGTNGVNKRILRQLMERLDRTEFLLKERDEFIVEHDLWEEFCEWLHRNKSENALEKILLEVCVLVEDACRYGGDNIPPSISTKARKLHEQLVSIMEKDQNDPKI